MDVETYEPQSLPLLKDFKPRPPSITFSDRLDLYVGGHEFNLFYLPGHTQSHIGVYMPKEKIFFTGDNFTHNTQPSFAHSTPAGWVKSLKKIEAMDIDIVVPGHGTVCTKKELHEFRLYIELCVNMVKKAIKAGMSKEKAADTISFDGIYPKEKPAQPLHAETEWRRRNVMRVYEMLAGEDNC
jgi:glyoxylase-like metal-dependent hydrolase (beta-lactamase superfamily II)